LKALIVREHGPIENLLLEDVPDPQPGPGEVLVDVHAASVNFPDLLVIGGTYQILPKRPFSPGKDMAGVVAAVGTGVTTCKPGDRVAAQNEYGAYAQKCVVPQNNCYPMPDVMSFADAAAMGIAYPTAHFALVERGQYQPGETVLINGAAGGVGIATIQVAKALGATVVASVSSAAPTMWCAPMCPICVTPSATRCLPRSANAVSTSSSIRSAATSSTPACA
jgi:NADPH2:quinone reductase